VLSAVKRDLAKQTARLVGDRRVTPLEAAALILGKIKRDAEERHFHDPVTRAVITCPAIFDEAEKAKLREAAALAGFREVELLEEPVAAALAYAEAGIKVGRYVLVYDLGGGTFDLALLAHEERDDTYRVALEPRGERVGGEDFDRAIYEYFEAIVRKRTEQPICPDGLDLHLLRRCRRLKETLSASEQTDALTWYWPGKGQLTLPALNRQRFESLIEKPVERTLRLTQLIRQDAAADGYHLESVILIGGASRTPCIVRRLQDTLQIEPRNWQKQDVAVALGAAYHAQRLWGVKPGLPGPVQNKSVRPSTISSGPTILGVLPVNEDTPKTSYPGLFDPATGELHALHGRASFVIGRSETADVPVLDLSCSRQQFRIVRVEGQHYVEPLSRNSPTYLNGQAISKLTPLAHEDLLQAAGCRFVFLARERSTEAGQPAPAAPAARESGRGANPPPVLSEHVVTEIAGSPGSGAPPPPAEELKPCPMCGEMIRANALKCRFCGEIFDEPPRPAAGRKRRKKSSAGRVCSILSIIFGSIAFILFPPLFGMAGVILGIVGVIQSKSKTRGVIGIVVSVFGTIIGMILSAIVMAKLR
jgi:hypothetical protein